MVGYATGRVLYPYLVYPPLIDELVKVKVRILKQAVHIAGFETASIH
jgi:hypothetical protein